MLRLLECALALDKHRNFARAAAHVGVSQPTLTRNIQELERQLGAKLFDRNTRGVEATSFGAIVLKSADCVALDIAEMKRDIALLKGLSLGELTIGVGSVVAQTWIGDAIGNLLSMHPKLQIRMVDLDWWDIATELKERRIDLAVGEIQGASDNHDIVVRPLSHRAINFYSRAGHPLQRHKKVTLRDIGEHPLAAPKLPKRVNEFFGAEKAMGQMAENGHYFEPSIMCPNLETIVGIVRASNAVGIATVRKMNSVVAAGDLAKIRFEAPWMRTNYAIMHLRERTLAPAAVAFCAEALAAEQRYNETDAPQPVTGRKPRR